MRWSVISWIMVATLVCTAAAGFARGLRGIYDSTCQGQSTKSPVRTSADTIVDPPINWPVSIGVQQTGRINASFTDAGTFGQGFAPGLTPAGWPPVSFESPPGSNTMYLFAGAIWVGGIVNGDTLVSVGADGWQYVREMFPPEYPDRGSIYEFDYPADFSMRAEFYDTLTEGVQYDYFGGPHTPLNLRLANRSHVWRIDPYNWAIMYDLIITNIGDDFIDAAYFGIYFDGDVCSGTPWCDGVGFDDDVTGSIRSKGIAYIIDNDGELIQYPVRPPLLRAFAFKYLRASFSTIDTSYNWWISNGNPAYDFGPRQRPTAEDPWFDFLTGGIGTPEGNRNKYYIMSFPEWDYDQIYTAGIDSTDSVWSDPHFGAITDPLLEDFSDGWDTRFLLSIGLFDLLPDSSIRILYTTFTADSVHTDSNNTINLPFDPDTYLANLNFDGLLDHAAVADTLAQWLLDPLLPVIGLQVAGKSGNDVTVRWDPWVFPDVVGYEAYLWQIPPDSLPHPGVVPPWLRPTELNPVATVGLEAEYTFTGLDPDHYYLANVAHLTNAREVGDPGTPLPLWAGGRGQPPQFAIEYVFFEDADSVVLEWEPPDKSAVSCYRVYRFPDTTAAKQAYHAFYDQGAALTSLVPKDSFIVDGEPYYYYAMDVYAEFPCCQATFTDTGVVEGMSYIVAAVDDKGFESEFSIVVEAQQVLPRTREILLITGVAPVGIQFARKDSIISYYDAILAGYDYDIYDFTDTSSLPNCPSLDPAECVDWHDFTRYDLVIIDGGIPDLNTATPLSSAYEAETKGVTKYLLSGGRLAYFGNFDRLLNLGPTDPTGYYDAGCGFIDRFFGTDSIYYVTPTHFVLENLPMVDTIFAFDWAQGDGSLPDLYFDTARDPFTPGEHTFWPPGTPPAVATYAPDSNGNVTHLYRALPGVNSINEGQSVGIHTVTDNAETYLFGFHLWYMTYADGQALIDYLMTSPPKTVLEPDTISILFGFMIEPPPVTAYLGELSDGHTLNQLDFNSIRINGTIEPDQVVLLPGYPGFDGQVLEIQVPVRSFLGSYDALWDITRQAYQLSGTFDDASSLSAAGQVTIIGRICGDVNLDAAVNIADLSTLVDYLFRGGPPPLIPETADVDGQPRVNVADLSYLVSYLYLEGPPPTACPR